MAKPPFVVGELKSKEITEDKVFPLITDTTFFILPINEMGIYQILESENTENGMSILAFENDFPKISGSIVLASFTHVCGCESCVQSVG